MPDDVRAVIVDDEPAAREVIVALLAEHARVRIVGEAGNGQQAVAVLRATRPDLVFLDVQMPDLDGFGVLDALGADVPRGVVFVTAHDEHAIRAFDVHALDYVLKPFGRPRFSAAVERALERLRALDALTLQQTLASMASDRRADTEPAGEVALLEPPTAAGAPPAPIRRIGVRTGTRTVLVEVASIDWVEAFGDYARIHVGKQTYLVSQRMHVLERLLETGGFARIHRSLMANLSRVRELHREADGSGTVVLDGGVRLRVSRGRWEALHAALALEEF